MKSRRRKIRKTKIILTVFHCSLASETGLAPTHSIKKLKSIFSEKEEGEWIQSS